MSVQMKQANPFVVTIKQLGLLVFVDDLEDSLHGSRSNTWELLFFIANHCESMKSKGNNRTKSRDFH